MRNNRQDPDKIELKERKGVWKRFLKIFPKCRLPWVWLIAYILLSMGVINVGLSETEYTAQLFDGDTSAALLTKLIGVLLVNLLGSSIAVFVRIITSARINRNMRKVVLNKALRLPMSFFKDDDPREIIHRVVNNSIVMDSTIMVFIIPVAMAVYKAASVLGKVFKYDWRLTLILLGFLPVQIFIAWIFGRINFSLSRTDSGLHARLTQRLSELVTNIPLAKAFVKEDVEAQKGVELSDRLYRVSIRSSWLDQFKSASETVVSLLQSALIVGVGVAMLGSGAIEKRGWISFYMFSSVFSGAVEEFMMYWNNVKVIQGNADRVLEILDAPEEDLTGEPCKDLTGDLELTDVSFGYTDDRTVLNNVSCTFQDNSVTALLGVSGCGKTTLTHLLNRLYAPNSGAVTVGGKSVGDFALEDYRAQFETVSQSGMLFSGTIRENLLYGNDDAADEALTDALRRAGAYDFVMAMPEGLDSRLEEYGSNLSGGQRQRLAMARALLSDAHYLILDEPTASMDAIATEELMETLKTVAQGRCAILIGHTAAALSIADRAVVIEDGTVSDQGTVEEVKARNPFVRDLLGKKVAQ